MSVKKMIQMYVNYELDERTWNMMYEMTVHGLISRDNWEKFYKTAADWRLSEDRQKVVDSEDKVYYTRDKNGFLAKA